MGLEIEQDEFGEEDFRRFSEKLGACKEALAEVLARAGFGCGETTIGAELECNLVDEAGRPAMVNRAVLAGMHDDRVTLEVDRFNMEINAKPFPLAGAPFAATSRELTNALEAIRRAARAHGAEPVTIGILPTLREEDLTSSALTEGHRYRALSSGLRRLRGEPFPLHIHGEDALDLRADDVAYEGANTSLQVHLRTNPAEFAATYNAAQIATAITLAISGNSPLFLGRRLWEETRIALFRQSVDDRVSASDNDWRPARVSFGHGWVREGALELFREAVHLHEPLLPVSTEEDPLAVVRAGGIPRLAELRLHHGTIWRWNRAIYDDSAGGHLRIEMRALPAGPTVKDMIANAAFLLGLTLGLRRSADDLVTRITFGHVRRNFYEAARRGLDAELLWPWGEGPSPKLLRANDLALHLLPLAREGLVRERVSSDDADSALGIIHARLASGSTGARWQRCTFARLLQSGLDANEASRSLVVRYRELSESGEPVHTWPSH